MSRLRVASTVASPTFPGVKVLHQALSSAAATLLDQMRNTREQDLTYTHEQLQTKLAMLAHPNDSATNAWQNALQHAWLRLAQVCNNQEALQLLATTLLPPQHSSTQLFWRLACEELLLRSACNLGRVLDTYRREMRWHTPQLATLDWSTLEQLLQLLLQTLLPQTWADEPALTPMLLTAEERQLLDTIDSSALPQSHATAVEQLLHDLERVPSIVQVISASEDSAVTHTTLNQTIVLPSDLTAAVVAPIDLANLADHYRHYCRFLLDTFGALDFRGILHLHNAVRLRVDDLYIPLMARRTVTLPLTQPTAALSASNWLHSSQPDSDDYVPLHHFIRDLPFLVVLGGPGAGKSTLVKIVLLTLAAGQGSEQFGLTDQWLPIFFPVAAFAEARREPGNTDLAPLVYLQRYYQGLSQPDYLPLFLRALAAGKALVLFDGLDEVREERLSLTHCLEAFIKEWELPGNRFLATSRIAGYDDAPLDDQLFARVTIQPLTDDGIRSFIWRWCNAYERAGLEASSVSSAAATEATAAPGFDREQREQEIQRRAIYRAADLTNAVFSAPKVTTLARSPLLLSILALIHHQGASLPDRRVDLYRLCVEALGETWNRARSLSGREVDVYLGTEKLDERFVVNLLGPAALWMQENYPGGVVERQDLEQQITQTLCQTDGLPYGRAQRLAHNFINLVQSDIGLLQERGYQRYGFVHLTFEEYLAARALLESVTIADPDQLIHERCTDPRWREVLRLMVAAASQREAQRLLLHLLVAPTNAETHGQPVVLAGECLIDIGRNSATQRAWSAVIEQLSTLLDDPTVPHSTRLAGGQTLARLGDLRLLDLRTGDNAAATYWCHLAAGPFWVCATHDNTPRQQRRLPYPYAIARYPVTNIDYCHFIEAGGYQERGWWTDRGWTFITDRHQEPIYQPSYWQHSTFNGANQPVVGISWYEAAAYCAWLSAEGQQRGWLASDEQIRLPTALEWERAARHTDQRRYPWGDAPPHPDYANYDATNLHAPAPVGCYPAGAAVCGARDLAGNVWEWTTTRTDQTNQIPHIAPHPDFVRNEKPAILGGAFNWSQDYLHCGAHYWFSPRRRQNLLGFRLVRVPIAIPIDEN